MLVACYGGFSFSFGLHVEVCALFSVCVVLYLVFVLAGPVIDREMYLLRATRTFGKKRTSS